MAAFQKKLHVAYGFAVNLGRGQQLDAGAEAALDVVLQAGTRMVTRQIHFAGRNKEVAVNQIDDAIGEIGGEEGSVVGATILAQAASHVNSRKTLAQSEFHVRVGFVIAQQDVEARLLLLDEIVLECQRLFIIGDDNVVDVDGLANERPGLCIQPPAFMKIRGNPGAQILCLADVDDFAFGVLVQVHAGGGGQGADFLRQIHQILIFILS